MTYSLPVVLRAVEAFERGMSKKAISRELGVSRSAIRSWVAGDVAALRASRTRLVCDGGPACELVSGAPREAYAYLLGQYLGDGCISQMKPGVFRVRIIACSAYPGIDAEIRAALSAVFPSNSIGSVELEGCREIYVYSKHAVCLFPQHGAGPKHKRVIELSAWQQAIVEEHTRPFLRGLIHSDGCRALNKVKVRGRNYEYPRYFFSNRSHDILEIFTKACDRLGIEWKQNYIWSISVARRDSVALLDTFVGPKT